MNGTATMHTTIGGLAATASDARITARPWSSSTRSPSTVGCGDRRSPSSTPSTRAACHRRPPPGHGESPDAAAYDLAATVEQVHQLILDAGLSIRSWSGTRPVPPCRRLRRPVSDPRDHRGRGHGVGRPLRRASSGRSSLSFAATASRPHGRSVSTPVFGLDDVSDDVRAFVEDASRPRPEVVISSWSDLLTRSTDELESLIAGAAQAIETAGIPVTALFGRQPSPAEVA